MDDDDTTDEPMPINSEEEREMVSFMLEASRCTQHEDRNRTERCGESSTSRNMRQGSLVAHIEGVPGSGPARPLQTCIGGSARNPAKGPHRAQAEGSRPFNAQHSLPLRIPMPDQTPPGGRSKYVGDQASFRLQHIMGASRSEGSHTFVRPDTKWDGNVVKLWLNPSSAKGWYWNNGHQLQMACEAAEILFDQRPLAQCWAIREATLAEVLPEGYCSTEPDIE